MCVHAHICLRTHIYVCTYLSRSISIPFHLYRLFHSIHSFYSLHSLHSPLLSPLSFSAAPILHRRRRPRHSSVHVCTYLHPFFHPPICHSSIYHPCICPSIHPFAMQSFYDFRRDHSRHASLYAFTYYGSVLLFAAMLVDTCKLRCLQF